MRIGVVCVALVPGLLLGTPPASAGLYKELTETPTNQSTLMTSVRANPYAEIVTRPVDKFCRGLINTMTGVLEIPRTIGDTAQKHGLRAAATTGVVKGVKRVGIRTASGLIDVTTFPAPPYHRLRIKPEFVAGTSSLYRGLPEGIHWDALEAQGVPLPDGPLAASITVLTAPLPPQRPPAQTATDQLR